MKYFVGIDCSSKGIHSVVLDNEGNISLWFVCKSSKKTADERLYDLNDQFKKIVNYFDKNYTVAIEKAIYRQNAISTISIAQVITSVKLALDVKGIVHGVVDNKTWKKISVGKGNCTKDEIKAYAIGRWQMAENLDQDLYDSACIAEYIYLKGKEE